MSSLDARRRWTWESDLGTNSIMSEFASLEKNSATIASGRLFDMARWCIRARARTVSAGPLSVKLIRSVFDQPTEELGFVRSSTRGSSLFSPDFLHSR